MDDSQSLTTPLTGCFESLPVPPRLVLAGLATLQRQELCNFLAIFDQLSAMRVASDSIRDLRDRLPGHSPQIERAFKRRVQRAADAHYRSEYPDAHLRLLVWIAVRDALGLSRLIPLAVATADKRSAEVASRTAQELSHNIRSKSAPDDLARWGKATARIRAIFSADQNADFGDVVRFEVARRIGECAEALPPDLREQIVASLRDRVAALPDELRDAALEEAIRTGNLKMLSTLATGTAWGGVAVAVALADFSAYILAAKAATLIPLLGAKTAVSALAVLTNPLFGIALVGGGAWWINKHMNRKLRRGQASQLCCVLAMRGLACGTAEAELKRCLDDFKLVGASTYEPVDESGRQVIAEAKERQRAVIDCLQESLASDPKLAAYFEASELPATPGAGADELPPPLRPDGRHHSARRLGVTGEVAVVEGLTFAELVHDVALIDPRVVAAADFSRTESLNDVFSFGSFAERVHDLSEAARTGAENNLLGYIAEVFVAVRLKGHDVEFPATPNNPGHDLLVDGQPFQVKCYADEGAAVEALEEHFSLYTDTPVFISDVQSAVEASGASWVDRVFYVDGYDHESIKTLMDESLDAGVDLGDLSSPLFAAVFVGCRNLYRWHRGSIPLRDLPLEVVLDSSIYGALAVAGSLAGKLIGVILFGPAGAVIFGSAGGPAALFGSRHVRHLVDKRLMAGWLRDVEAATTDFGHVLTDAMRRKVVRNYERISQLGDLSDPLRAWLRLIFEDRALAVAECMADMSDLHGQYRQEPVDGAEASLRLLRDADIHPGSVRGPLEELTRALTERPTTTEAVYATTAPTLKRLTNVASSGLGALRRKGSSGK